MDGFIFLITNIISNYLFMIFKNHKNIVFFSATIPASTSTTSIDNEGYGVTFTFWRDIGEYWAYVERDR